MKTPQVALCQLVYRTTPHSRAGYPCVLVRPEWIENLSLELMVCLCTLWTDPTHITRNTSAYGVGQFTQTPYYY